MRESIFQGEWIKSWRHHYPRCHIVKVPDMPKTAGARFLPPRPYDIYVVWNGRFYAMELKLKTDLGGFPFKEATEWQINNLKEAKENGAESLIIINYRVQKISDKQRIKNDFLPKGRLSIVFIFTIDEFIDMDKNFYSKSIPVKMLFEPRVRTIQKIVDYWDIPAFLAYGGNK